MLKWIGLMFLGALLIAGSCYRWDRVSDSGVLSQETCADIPVGDPRRADCKNPEDFKDSVVVDPATGDTTVVSREMFKGRPNGMGWIWAILGVAALFYGGLRLVQAIRNRKKPDDPRPLRSSGGTFALLALQDTASFTGPVSDKVDYGALGVGVLVALAVIIFVAIARDRNPRYPKASVKS